MLPSIILLEDDILDIHPLITRVLLPSIILLEDDTPPLTFAFKGVLLPYIYLLDVTYVLLQTMLFSILTEQKIV